MSEEKKIEVEEVKVSKEDQVKLAKIEIGSDYTAKISVDLTDDKSTDKISFMFNVHIPSMKEELKITIKEEEILGKISLNTMTNVAVKILATLDIAIDGIYINGKKQECSFWEMAQNIKQVGKFYKQVVFPVYEEFIGFQNSVEMDFEDLKKTLAQPGKN